MNIKEGMRRFGILAGVCGGLLGGFLAYGEAQQLWSLRTAHKRFEALMASATMQRLAKAVWDYKNAKSKFGGIRVVEPHTLTYADGTIWEDVPQGTTHITKLSPGKYRVETKTGTYDIETEESDSHSSAIPKRDQFGDIPVPNFDQWKVEQQHADELKAAGAIPVSVNLEGIKDVTVDKAGLVSSVELSTGESVQRTEPPTLRAYLIPLLYPILGFLLPWGAVRVLTWVGSGFFVPHQ